MTLTAGRLLALMAGGMDENVMEKKVVEVFKAQMLATFFEKQLVGHQR